MGVLLTLTPLGVFAQYDPSSSIQWQAASENASVKFNADAMNTSLPSSSTYNQWITSQSEAMNAGVGQNATQLNSTINQNIYNPNQSNTDLNTALYNAGSVTNQSIGSGLTCNTSIKKIGDIFILGACIINRFLISIAISLAVIYFMWGIVQYVLSADSAEERKKSKQVMLWGILSLFFIVSMWGIVAAMRTVLGI